MKFLPGCLVGFFLGVLSCFLLFMLIGSMSGG